MRKAIYLVIILMQFQSSFSQERSEIDSLIQLSESVSDSMKADLYLNIAVGYRTVDVSNAYQFALKGMQLAHAQGLAEIEADAHNILGSIYTVLGDFEKANLQLHEALKLNELLGRKRGVANTSNSLGVLYFNQKDYQNALKYYQKAFQLVDTISYTGGYATFSLNIGEVYQVLGNHQKAKQLLEKALSVFVADNDQEGIAYCHGILAKSAFQEQNFRRALEQCIMALNYFELDANVLGRVEYLILLSKIYMKQNIFLPAEKSASTAVKIAKELNAMQWMMEAHEQLANLYRERGLFEQAYFHIDTAKELRTQILHEKGQKQINNMRIIYESDRLLRENELLKVKSELSEKAIDKQRFITLIIGICLLAIAIFAFVIYRANKIKQKSNLALRTQNEEIRQQGEEILTQAEGLKHINREVIQKNKLIESKNKDITDSINYAQRIQSALLPFKSRINSGFPENFILYKPKDIVSGDFYWYGEVGDKVVIAVADCTGHGIPGAFMSFIGHDMLNYICNIEGISSPAEILKRMKHSVIRQLRQKDSDNRDGLDISICSWDKNSNELVFAGANHSLIYIQDNNLNHVKGDRTTIGMDEKNNYNQFEEHAISVVKDTAFYLYTDGFVDQFGGPDDKKFMVSPFKELLLKNHLKQMSTQGQILTETLDEWMGEAEQIDDVLVFGFRLFD